jgi:hypothetical protein
MKKGKGEREKEVTKTCLEMTMLSYKVHVYQLRKYTVVKNER